MTDQISTALHIARKSRYDGGFPIANGQLVLISGSYSTP